MSFEKTFINRIKLQYLRQKAIRYCSISKIIKSIH